MTQQKTITLEWVRLEKAKHQAVLADLEAVERVLLGKQPESYNALGAVANEVESQKVYGTKKRILLQVISESPIGLPTAGIIREGIKAGLKNLKTENTSPQISLYKSDGLLDLDMNGFWKITDKGRDYLAATKS